MASREVGGKIVVELWEQGNSDRKYTFGYAPGQSGHRGEWKPTG
jgi:hypothetical protein